MVRIGELDQRITLQEKTTEPDGAGGEVATWTDRGSVWAHIRPQTGGERMQNDTTVAEGRMRLWLRNQSKGRELDETWRIVWRGRVYNIDWIGPTSPRSMYREIQLTVGAPA